MMKILQKQPNRRFFALQPRFIFSSYSYLIDEALKSFHAEERKIEKNGYFYDIPATLLSLNPLQRDRYEIFDQKINKEKSIFLFENNSRESSINKTLQILEQRSKVLVTGALGLGKSHLLSLLFCHLTDKINRPADSTIRIPEIFLPQNTKIFYINNPKIYYYEFVQSIINDIVCFIGKDFESEKGQMFLEKLYKVTFSKLDDVDSFFEEVITFYASENKNCVFIIDQINETTRKSQSEKLNDLIH